MKKFIYLTGRIVRAPFRAVFWVIKGMVKSAGNFIAKVNAFLTSEPDDTELPDMVEKVVHAPSSLFPHIDALRKHILRALLFLFFTTAISFVYAQTILDWLASPLGKSSSGLIIIDVTEPISVFMRVSLLSGFALALPYIVLEIVLFVGEGLRRKTRLFLVFFVIPASTLLFVAGMAFAYFVMLPVAVPFLLHVMNFQTSVRASSYIKFVTGVMFWIGIIFEFPMVIFIAARLGWVRASMLLKQWRVAVVLIAVIAAMVTPTIDPVNMAIVMAPMILLYFLSIGLAFIAQKRLPPLEA